MMPMMMMIEQKMMMIMMTMITLMVHTAVDARLMNIDFYVASVCVYVLAYLLVCVLSDFTRIQDICCLICYLGIYVLGMQRK